MRSGWGNSTEFLEEVQNVESVDWIGGDPNQETSNG